MSELDPITGSDPSTLSVAVLAERLAMERALREQDAANVAANLKRQATEYERRLESLNGETGRIADVLEKSVPREVYEAYVKASDREFAAAVDTLSNRIDIERSARIRLEGSLSTWRFLAGFLGISGFIGVLLGLVAVFGPK